MPTNDQAKYKIILDESQFNAAINKSIKRAGLLDSKMGGVQRSTRKTGSVFKGLVGFNIFTAAISGAASFISSSIQVVAQVDAINRALKITSGSTEEFTKNMEFLTLVTDKMGLEVMSTKDAFKTLSAATMGTNLQGVQTRKIFASVANATSKLGVDAEATKGAFLALGQMVSKGKVSAEELRGQLGERLPGAFGIAAKAMGVTTAQLDKMLVQGKVVSEDFLPKFANALNKKFGDPVKANAQSVQANLNRMSNLWTNFKASMIKLFGPIISKISQFVNAVKSSWEEIREAFRPMRELFRDFGKSIGMVGGEVKKSIPFMTKFRYMVNKIGDSIRIWAARMRPITKFLAAIINHLKKVGAAIADLIPEGTFDMFDDFGKKFTTGLLLIEKISSRVTKGIKLQWQGLWENDAAKTLVGRGLTSLKSMQAAAKAAQREADIAHTSVNLFANKKKKKDPLAALINGDATESMLSGASGGGAGSGGGARAQNSTSVDGVSSGRPTSINISIDKLIETFSIETTNMKNSASELREMVSKTLLTAVNDVNLIGQ